MARTIGVLIAAQIAVGLVENGVTVGGVKLYPESAAAASALDEMAAGNLSECILHQIEGVWQEEMVEAIGVGVPGIICDGIVEDSPNLPQIKGFKLQENLAARLRERGRAIPLRIFNDADVIAAGVAATRGELNRFIRIWNLGRGIGYGRYPWTDGIWEGGHCVVTLSPRETFCGCGGRGHLEGIMGSRSMRLRFLDMEPEEVFASAKSGDQRCSEFVELWHRALAAATATSIAMEGPGRFFITGPGSRFIEIGRLGIYLHEMVKMSPLQGSQLEVVSTGVETGIVGAAVNAGLVARARG